MNDNEQLYYYPNNLAEKPKIGLWNVNDLVVVAVVGFGAVMISLKSGPENVWIGLIIAAGFGLLLARFDDHSVYEELIIMMNYLKSPQVWEYQSGPSLNTVSKSKESKKKKRNENYSSKKSKSKSSVGIPYLVISVLLIVGFLVIILKTNGVKFR